MIEKDGKGTFFFLLVSHKCVHGMLSWEDLVALKKAGSFGGLEKGREFWWP